MVSTSLVSNEYPGLLNVKGPDFEADGSALNNDCCMVRNITTISLYTLMTLSTNATKVQDDFRMYRDWLKLWQPLLPGACNWIAFKVVCLPYIIPNILKGIYNFNESLAKYQHTPFIIPTKCTFLILKFIGSVCLLAQIQDTSQTQGPNLVQIVIYTAKQNIYYHTKIHSQTQC